MESEGIMYAVFECHGKENNHEKDIGYLIQKIGSVEGTGNDDVLELGQPIQTLKSSKYPSSMSFFSIGSKLYFCGGYVITGSLPVYISEAYMFDINSSNPNECGIVSIQSMNYPKPRPFVFGPVDDHKFYVLGVSRDGPCIGCPSFEMLDTSTNLWENISVPESLSNESIHSSSALCGSNILISNQSRDCLYVFCTRTGIWRILDDPCSIEPSTLPFFKARPLFRGNKYGHILLASPSRNSLPQVYLSWHLPQAEAYLDLVHHFASLGEVDGMVMHLDEIPDFLGGWGTLAHFFSFNDNRICVVRSPKKGFSEDKRFAIDIFRVSYSFLGNPYLRIIVKVENALRYKYCCKVLMDPKYFFVVG